jgi:hypothetical protein
MTCVCSVTSRATLKSPRTAPSAATRSCLATNEVTHVVGLVCTDRGHIRSSCGGRDRSSAPACGGPCFAPWRTATAVTPARMWTPWKVHTVCVCVHTWACLLLTLTHMGRPDAVRDKPGAAVAAAVGGHAARESQRAQRRDQVRRVPGHLAKHSHRHGGMPTHACARAERERESKRSWATG